MFDGEDAEAAWVYCPGPPSRAPIELLRVIASGEAPEVGDAPDGGCVPMDGKWIVFSGEAGQWDEEQGGNFWGYGNAYEFAEGVFLFDPLLGRRLQCDEEAGREFWPVAVSDVETLEEMGGSWPESLARCMAAIPARRRGDSFLRVPELLRVDFGRWCCALEDASVFEGGPLVGTPAFREVVRECAARMRLVPWACASG